jgi:hypothetical protein
MTGLVALAVCFLAYRLVKNGWRDFYPADLGTPRSRSQVILFVIVAATLTAAAFVGSYALFADKHFYWMDFSIDLAATNFGGLWLLSVVARTRGKRPGYLASASRVATGFFVVYFFSLAEPMRQAFNISCSY